jgi:hypothetical protein
MTATSPENGAASMVDLDRYSVSLADETQGAHRAMVPFSTHPWVAFSLVISVLPVLLHGWQQGNCEVCSALMSATSLSVDMQAEAQQMVQQTTLGTTAMQSALDSYEPHARPFSPPPGAAPVHRFSPTGVGAPANLIAPAYSNLRHPAT